MGYKQHKYRSGNRTDHELHTTNISEWKQDKPWATHNTNIAVETGQTMSYTQHISVTTGQVMGYNK
jgi:hypothetical protein